MGGVKAAALTPCSSKLALPRLNLGLNDGDPIAVGKRSSVDIRLAFKDDQGCIDFVVLGADLSLKNFLQKGFRARVIRLTVFVDAFLVMLTFSSSSHSGLNEAPSTILL